MPRRLCQESCTVVGDALFEVFGGVDAFDVALDAGKPVPSGEPICAGNTAVDTRAYLFSESASAVRDMDDTTTRGDFGNMQALPVAGQDNRTFVSPKSCDSGVVRRSEERTHGERFERTHDEGVFTACQAITTHHTNVTTMHSGDVRGTRHIFPHVHSSGTFF